MSDFERRREKNKEARELVKIRRENIAKYTFDHLVYFWSWLSCYRMIRIYWKFNT